MQAGVKECEQSQHPAKPDCLVPAGEAPERRDAQGQDEETENPVAGSVSDLLNGVGAQVVCERPPDEQEKRDKAEKEYENLQCLDQKLVRRSRPVYIFSTY